jgi:anti-anti-sigma regulatory factor
MRWPRGRRAQPPARPAIDPVVLSVTSALTRQTAVDLGRRLDRLEPTAPVVIDLTAIPSFDSDGAAELMHLQESHRDRNLSIVGFRQATSRLVGAIDEQAPRLRTESGWTHRNLRNLVVVQPLDEHAVTVDGLEAALSAATATQSAIVVVDLRGVEDIDLATVDVIAFASSTAAIQGQEMLIVNVKQSVSDALRGAGLSATTYVAPEPPPLP